MFFVGTSGFNYSKWKGKFYPDELLKSKWLEYYVKYFNSLELNSMFYKIPKEATIKSWKYKLKKLNLILSIKANKIITHTYKLKNFDKTNKFLELNEFLQTIINQSNIGFCYFNNTDDVSAPYDALRFRKLIEK